VINRGKSLILRFYSRRYGEGSSTAILMFEQFRKWSDPWDSIRLRIVYDWLTSLCMWQLIHHSFSWH